MQSDEGKPNGGGQAELVPAGEVIVITFTRKPWAVLVDCKGAEAELAKAVLLAGVDALDAQIRLARVQALQAQQAENARVAAILAKGKGVFQQ